MIDLAAATPLRRVSFVIGLAMILVVVGVLVRAAPFKPHWTKIPSVTVVSADGDSRIGAVHEALGFWNRTFADLGTPFRLGDVTFVTGSVPDQDIQYLGDQVLRHSEGATMPASLARIPGDLVIILSDAHFISFTAHRGNRVVVAIKNGNTLPLTLPNVLHNVIAHELGHAVGLEHNDDPAMLMCGRPAACRPDAFESATPGIFPLSEVELTRLRTLYPRDWTARGSSTPSRASD